MLLVTHFGSRYDLNVSGTLGSSYGELVKLAVLAYYKQFCILLVIDFGSQCDSNVSGTSASGYGELIKTRSFGLFWTVLYAISH